MAFARATLSVRICVLISFLFASAFPAIAQTKSTQSTNRENNDPEREREEHQPEGSIDHAEKLPDEDPDVPWFAGKIDKEEFHEARDQYIRMMRGLPYPDGMPNPREAAIRVMEAQQPRRPVVPMSLRIGANISPTVWTSIGPSPIPNGQTTALSVPVSGRITAIAVHPTNPDLIYVGAAQGGVFRSLDGGSTWTALTDNALSLAIGAIAIVPSDPSTILVGTGEGNGSSDSFFGVGIYRIRNADGVNPTLEGPFRNTAANVDVMSGRSITSILIHPTNPDIVFVGMAGGTAGNPGSSAGLTVPQMRFFRSLNMNQAAPTFAALNVPTGIANTVISDAIFDPTNPNNLWVSVNAVQTAVIGGTTFSVGGIWSTNNALAATPAFTLRLPLNSINVKFAKTNAGGVFTLYAATGETVSGSPCTASAQGAVRVWNAATSTFSLLAGGKGFCTGQCFYDIAVAADPLNASKILIGGSSNSASTNPCRASVQMMSTNGGVSFARNDVGLHADNHVIVFAPSNNQIIYGGNDGGAFRSNDGGTSWVSLNTAGMHATQFQSVASHPGDRYLHIGGTQDNGTQLMQSNNSWTRTDFGDGGHALIDTSTNDEQKTVMYHTYFNQTTSSTCGYARVSSLADAHDNGWSFLSGICSGNSAVLFYAPLALGPGSPNSVYFASDRLFRAAGPDSAPAVVSQAPIVSGSPITTISIARQNDNIRLLGLANGKIYSNLTAVNTFVDITNAAMPVRVVGRVAIDPNNSNIAYATFGGFGVTAGQHVWKTLNLAGGATTWVPAGTGLPDVPTNAFVIDPRNSSNLYAGTDIGVYSSIDGGNSWQPYGTGLPRVAVFDLDIQSTARVLRAATHGRGMWEIAIDGTPSGLLAITNVSITPGPGGNGNAFIEPGERGQISVQVANNGTAGATGITVTLSSLNSNVALTSATVPIADLAAGGSGVTSVPLTFNVPTTTTCGAGAKFAISVNWAGATTPRTKSVSYALGAPGSTSSTFTYAGPPVAIPDNNAAGVSVPLAVSGISGAVSSVKLTIGGSACSTAIGSTTVGIDHTFVGDLALILISPSGTAVQLTPVSSNAGVNFCNTTFDDSASVVWTASSPAQNASYRPFAPLSTFAGDTANGTWQLKVVDGGPADIGSVRAFSITVTGSSCAAPCPVLSLAPAALPAGTAGSPYNQTLTATGGVAPYSFATSSPLPSGITLNSSGLLSGTTTQTGSFPITATATDFYGCSVTTNYTLVVRCPTIAVAPATLPAPTVGVLYSQTITASGGVGTYTFSSTGTLPPGLTLATGGLLSGTPTTAGPFTFSVTATDTAGCTGSASYSVTVNKGNPVVTWTNPADITYGTALGATQLNATANVGGTFAYSAAAGTVLAAGAAQSLSVTFTPTDAANYNNAVRTVVINVLRAALTIAADSKSKVYGTANPPLTVSYGGFVNGDTPSSLTGTLSVTTSAVQTSGAGTYPILVGGVSSANYTITFVPGVLTVTKAALTVRADDKSNYFGDPVPALTASYSGFVLTDTFASSVTGQPLLSTTATASSMAGTYPISISVGTLASANYAFTFVNGTLTIGGPQDAIQRAKADLTTLRASSTEKQTNDRLDRAIGDLADALEAKRWIDTSHLPSAEGSTVFQQAKNAVTDLAAIIADKNSGVSAAEVQASIDRIVRAVRGLAVIAVGSVDSDIQAGDSLIAQGKYESGIERYRVAWQAAVSK